MIVVVSIAWSAFSRSNGVGGGAEDIIRRWRIDAPWLGRSTEALLTPDCLVLRDAETGAFAALQLTNLGEVAEGGASVRCRVRGRGCWVDFGGVVFDGWYEIGCPDRDERVDLIAALRRASASLGRRPAGRPFLARIRRSPSQPR
jgi:hypothetical protein